MAYEDLLKLPREELVVRAAKLGIKAHHKSKPETIAKQIVEEANRRTLPTEQPNMKHTAEKRSSPVYTNTENDVLNALGNLMQKEGFTVKFHGDDTFTVKYNKREESFNMHIPPRVIRSRAEGVINGPQALRAMGKDGTYHGYADNILVG